ncbi:hypothetical protein HKBW3S25_01920, partial [Candidatus Hakubella thermalkaliphila]
MKTRAIDTKREARKATAMPIP